MAEKITSVKMRFEGEFCDRSCEHMIVYTMNPEIFTCKLSSNSLMYPDKSGSIKRTVNCRYMCGEDVQGRFWSPMYQG